MSHGMPVASDISTGSPMEILQISSFLIVLAGAFGRRCHLHGPLDQIARRKFPAVESNLEMGNDHWFCFCYRIHSTIHRT